MNEGPGEKKERITLKEVFTIPNILTYFRFILVPLFLTFYLTGFFSRTASGVGDEWIGIGAVILASLTDFADGKIARKYHLITELGKVMDPAADKLMQAAITVAVCIAYWFTTGKPYMLILLGFFVFKEISQFFFIWLTFRHGQYMDGAKWYGKVATFGFDVIMIVMLMLPLFYFDQGGMPEAAIISMDVMIFTVLAFLAFAYIMYLVECINLRRSGVNNIPPSLYPEWEKRYGKKATQPENGSKGESEE
jgi:cardiolipin synthase